MTSRIRGTLVPLLVSSLLWTSGSSADEPPEASPSSTTPTSNPDDRAEAAKDTTTPFVTTSQLTIKPSYTFPRGDNRYNAELLVEPIFRYDGFFLPDLTVSGFGSIARFQLSGESLQNSKGPAGGLDDLSFVDLVVHTLGPLKIGVGFGSVFPMATNPALGNGKWQLGPAAGLNLDPASWFTFSVLGQALWSVAGSSQSPTLAYATVQPFLAVHFPHALFLSSDATMNFYWAGGQSTVPVDLGFGGAVSKHVIPSGIFEYTVAMADRGDIKVLLSLKYRP